MAKKPMNKKYMDTTLSPEERAAELLKELSLKEKVYEVEFIKEVLYEEINSVE